MTQTDSEAGPCSRSARPSASRVALAVAVGALAAPAPLALLFLSAGPLGLVLALATILVGLMVSAPAILFIGLPAYFLLRDRAAFERWRAIVAGYVIGVVASAAAMGIAQWPYAAAGYPISPTAALAGGLFGVVGALAFRAVIVARRE